MLSNGIMMGVRLETVKLEAEGHYSEDLRRYKDMIEIVIHSCKNYLTNIHHTYKLNISSGFTEL